MGTFRSNLPLGTSDPTVFVEGNVPNFDEAVNSQNPTWDDRFGIKRLTLAGHGAKFENQLASQSSQFSGFMDSSSDTFQMFLDSSGYSGWETEYAAGIVLNSHNQGFTRCEPDGTACMFYTPLGTTPLPYTTTGDWASESALFVARSTDDVLRQDLANPSEGAALVAFVQEGDGAIAMPMLQKARQFLHGEDFGFMPDSGDVTENGRKLFFEARRQGKPVFLAKGVHTTSGSLDPSGIEVTGVFGGYRNNSGTIIEGDGTHHIFEQESNSTTRITYSLNNIHGQNALSLLKAGYCAFSKFISLSATQVNQGIVLTDPTIYGNLWNVFRQVNISALNEALVIDGSTVANANLLDTCYLQGGSIPESDTDYIPSVRINGSGGYGAVSNILQNTEIRGPGVGLELGVAPGTMLIGNYYESRGCSIVFKGAGKAKVIGGSFGSVNNGLMTPSSFIWHRSGGIYLDIDGPVVWLDASGGAQNNMKMIESSNPGSLVVNMPTPPNVRNTVSATGWGIFGSGLPTSLGYMNHLEDYDPTFTAASGSQPSVGSDGYIRGYYSRSGRTVTVDLEVRLGADGNITGNNWLFSLPFSALKRAVGQVRIFRSGYGVKTGICVVNESSPRMSVYATENPTAIGIGVPWAWQAGDQLSLSLTYSI